MCVLDVAVLQTPQENKTLHRWANLIVLGAESHPVVFQTGCCSGVQDSGGLVQPVHSKDST